MIPKKHLSHLFIILTLCILSCGDPGVTHEKNGAFDALQQFSRQRSYPDNSLKSKNYFEQIKKFQSTNTKTRNELPDPWEAIGPQNIAGRTLAIVINPLNNKTIFAGTASGGLWKSNNQGKGISWYKIPLGHAVLGVSSIAINPIDTMEIYIGTGEVYNLSGAGNGAAYRNLRGTYGMGILKTIDGGNTWTKSLDWTYELEKGVNMLKISPSDPNIIYAGTTDGVYRSEDSGDSWSLILDVPMCTDLLIHPEDPNDIVASCGNFGSEGKGIYSSRNAGILWTKFEPEPFNGKIHLAQFQQDPNLIFASVGNGFTFSEGATWVYKSLDGGMNWTLENTTDYSKWQGWFSHDLAIHPMDENKMTFVGIEIYQSNDGANTINQITEGGVIFGTPPLDSPDGPPNFTHSDHHDVIYDPTNGNTIYVATDGGVYGSFDGGKNWQSLNGGFQTTQFYNGFSVFDDEEFELAMGGLQDNSTVEYTGSVAWNRVIGGDGSWSAIHPTNPEIRFGSLQYLTLFKTSNGSNYERIVVPGSDLITSFIAPYVLSPSNPSFLYAGRAVIYKSNDAGASFNKVLGNGYNLNPAFSMAISHSNHNVLYIATAPYTERPKIFKTTNGGNNFIDITGSLPDQYINDIAINPNDHEEVYLTLGGFGDAHVFKSLDGGNNWIDITNNLPKIPSSAIIVDPLDENLLYLGNDYGIFYSEDGGLNWNTFNEGIIDAALVMDLKINAKKRKLYAATHGSGVFMRDMIARMNTSVSDWESLNTLEVSYSTYNNSIYFKGIPNIAGIAEMNIFSLRGERIYTSLFNFSESEYMHTLNVNLTEGLYLVHIQFSNNMSKSILIPFI